MTGEGHLDPLYPDIGAPSPGTPSVAGLWVAGESDNLLSRQVRGGLVTR